MEIVMDLLPCSSSKHHLVLFGRQENNISDPVHVAVNLDRSSSGLPEMRLAIAVEVDRNASGRRGWKWPS